MATTRIYANCGLAAAGSALALLGAPPAAAQTATPLANPSFEAPGVAVNGHNGQVTGSIANSWYDNSGYGDYTALYSLNSTNPHGGAACQNIALSAVRSGNLQMAQTVPLKGGSRYTISVWMRGTPGVLAAMTLQGPPPAYTPYADAWASLTGAWQQVSAQGYVPNDAQGAVYVSMNAPGSVCVDDVAVSYAPAPAP